jgi:hypothetical protein
MNNAGYREERIERDLQMMNDIDAGLHRRLTAEKGCFDVEQKPVDHVLLAYLDRKKREKEGKR